MTVTFDSLSDQLLRRLVIWALVVGGLLCAPSAWAELHMLTVRLTVVAKTCDINSGHPISVDMGDIMLNKINGSNYETTIPYTLECGDTSNNPLLRLKIDGNAMANQPANVLSTSNKNIGLRLREGGHDLALGHWIEFYYEEKPTLTIIPVRDSTVLKDSGDFSAIATINVEYL